MNVIQASTFGDLLNLIPNLLGYVPENSLVLLPMRDGRTGGAMRVNLPDSSVDEIDPHAQEVTALIERAEPDAVILITYGDDPVFAYAVAQHASVPIAGIFRVQGLTWMQPDGTSGTLEYSPDVADVRILTGTELPPVTRDEIREAESVAFDKEPSLSQAVRAGVVAAHGGTPVWVELAQILSMPSHRDTFLMTVAFGVFTGANAARAQEEWQDGAEYPVDLAQVMWGEGPKPHAERIEVAMEVVKRSLALIPTAGGYALMAWFSWALGRSTHAEHFVKEAYEMEPGYGLAQIVATFVASSHLPNWAFTR